MAVGRAPESFHSVTLSVDGRAYTANLWRGGAYQWRVLAVDIHGYGRFVIAKDDFPSCRDALGAAERLVQQLALDGALHRGGAA